MSKIEQAVLFMEEKAKNNKYGYDQRYRWGEYGDYDCSSLTITAFEQAGFPVKSKYGATYTGNMKQAFLKAGFKDIKDKVNIYTSTGLKRGDILLNQAHHVAVYCGSGLMVQASINEKGTTTNGKAGDQTGYEINISRYKNYRLGWDSVLRFEEKEISTMEETKKAKTQDSEPSHWAKEAWEYCKINKLLDGKRPKDNLTRQEMAVILNNLDERYVKIK